MSINELREQNKLLKQRIQDFKTQRAQNNMRSELDAYRTKLQNTFNDIRNKSIAEEQELNQKLHDLTRKYQTVLKEQIQLLTQNKNLSQNKDQQDTDLNKLMQKLAKEYQAQIEEYQGKVKINVKKIQQLSSTNIIKKLIQNQKFKNFMAKRGCNLQGLEKQSEIQQVSNEVQQKQKLIQTAELRSNALDQELQKMSQLVQTMKQLIQNMQKEKQNILKQNQILKQKLVQSEELIGKLLGNQQTQIQEQQNQEQENDENQNLSKN